MAGHKMCARRWRDQQGRERWGDREDEMRGVCVEQCCRDIECVAL